MTTSCQISVSTSCRSGKIYRNWSFNSYKFENYMKLNFENSTSLKFLKILFVPIILVALWRYLLNVSGGSGLAFCWCRLIRTSSTNTTKLSYLNQEHRKFSSSKWWSHFRCFFNFKLQVDKEREGSCSTNRSFCLLPTYLHSNLLKFWGKGEFCFFPYTVGY